MLSLTEHMKIVHPEFELIGTVSTKTSDGRIHTRCQWCDEELLEQSVEELLRKYAQE